ncbi:MAG: NAD-dependent epimerase/dehydratase family protein [Candidatus Omnitrophica bacterium]|nr:NAD-dependent epimerase/dehydratase family protein [Candidatus Omnitrophota bacterium]
MKEKIFNAKCTCRNCPAADFGGKSEKDQGGSEARVMVECRRRPELGFFDPTNVTFEKCSEWISTPYGYFLKDMRVMILGIDGYLGWTLALWLGKLGCKVSGVDNYNRRNWVKERGAHTVVPISRMTERLHAAKEVLGIHINFREIDILNKSSLKEFIDEIKPEAIVHYAECPSAPYSMIDFEHASLVQTNNVIGTLGVLFSMHEVVPETSLIKLGTMGEYGTPLSGRPLFEGFFPEDAVLHWKNRKWSMGGELTPRYPASFYHITKVQDTINVHQSCRYWQLRSYDVMQGVIYGVHTEQVAADPRLRTRLDIDEWFGTVVNRYVAQAIIGFPLTIFGGGGQTRGFISLEDAMQCITRLIAKPPAPGEYGVINQMSGYYNVKQLAETVAKIGSEEFDFDVKIQRVENPRIEANRHTFEPIFDKLPDEFGFIQSNTLENEIRRMFKLLSQPHIKSRIEEKRHLIMPRTWWSGVKKEVKRIEMLNNSIRETVAKQ